MRKFSSYGPINTKVHYYVPRTALIEHTYHQLVGEEPEEGGHYITIWAPRQTGKTWLLQQVAQQLDNTEEFDVAILTMQSTKNAETIEEALAVLTTGLRSWFQRDDIPALTRPNQLPELFTDQYFTRPLILILDEFDSLQSAFINAFVNEFRSIHTQHRNRLTKQGQKQTFFLHGLALIGVRSVLGIENTGGGSPFNVQRSVHVPNLTHAEVESMFRWYEQESGQQVEQAVIDRLFYETRGQPGLVGWFGELLTETYNRHADTITEHDFEATYAAGLNLLPNNNILNILSKAKVMPYRDTVLKLFDTQQKIPFRYGNETINYLYLNGIIEPEPAADLSYQARFASPFVQKRLFHYFADELTPSVTRLYDPFADLSDTITDTTLSIPHLMRRFETYFHQHRARLLRGVPRRASDNRVMEAIFHFNLYTWLFQFFADFEGGRVTPEFPTGNGKIDLLITYAGRLYGVEVKSFANRKQYQTALGQAARYAQELGQSEIWLVFFVEVISEENRQIFEAIYQDQATGVIVYPVFIATGEES